MSRRDDEEQADEDGFEVVSMSSLFSDWGLMILSPLVVGFWSRATKSLTLESGAIVVAVAVVVVVVQVRAINVDVVVKVVASLPSGINVGREFVTSGR